MGRVLTLERPQEWGNGGGEPPRTKEGNEGGGGGCEGVCLMLDTTAGCTVEKHKPF